MIRLFLSLAVIASTLASSVWAAASQSRASISSPSLVSPQLGFSGSLATVGGSYGGTFLLGINVPASRTSPIRLGVESGVMFGSGVGLPILVSVIHSFKEGSSVNPYVGGSLGPVIGLSGRSITIGGVTVEEGSAFGTGVKLAILVRPGVAFKVTDRLEAGIEVPIGGLTGVFYIAPTANLKVNL